MISTVNTPSHFQIWEFRNFGNSEFGKSAISANELFGRKLKNILTKTFFTTFFFLHTYIGTKVHRYLHSYYLNFSTELFVKMFLMKSRYVFTLFYLKLQSKNKPVWIKKSA